MPFTCENCGEIGARMNSIFKIRLCINCLHSPKYKLVSKSKALNKYRLTQSDLDNYPNSLEKYLVINPYYKSGPPMTLYYETQIEQVFLYKYNNLIYQLCIMEPNVDQIIKIIFNYHEEQKCIKKQKTKNNKNNKKQ